MKSVLSSLSYLNPISSRSRTVTHRGSAGVSLPQRTGGENKEGGRKEEAEKDAHAAFYFSREPLGESSRVPLAGALACSVQA